MKNGLRKLLCFLGISCAVNVLTVSNCNASFNNYEEDNIIETPFDNTLNNGMRLDTIKRANDVQRGVISKTFVQSGRVSIDDGQGSVTYNRLRFIAAINSNIKNLHYLRSVSEKEDNSEEILKVYKNLSYNDTTYYYDSLNDCLTSVEQDNDFYFAVVTIDMTERSTYLNKRVHVHFFGEDNSGNEITNAFMEASYTGASLKSTDRCLHEILDADENLSGRVLYESHSKAVPFSKDGKIGYKCSGCNKDLEQDLEYTSFDTIKGSSTSKKLGLTYSSNNDDGFALTFPNASNNTTKTPHFDMANGVGKDYTDGVKVSNCDYDKPLEVTVNRPCKIIIYIFIGSYDCTMKIWNKDYPNSVVSYCAETLPCSNFYALESEFELSAGTYCICGSVDSVNITFYAVEFVYSLANYNNESSENSFHFEKERITNFDRVNGAQITVSDSVMSSSETASYNYIHKNVAAGERYIANFKLKTTKTNAIIFTDNDGNVVYSYKSYQDNNSSKEYYRSSISVPTGATNLYLNSDADYEYFELFIVEDIYVSKDYLRVFGNIDKKTITLACNNTGEFDYGDGVLKKADYKPHWEQMLEANPTDFFGFEDLIANYSSTVVASDLLGAQNEYWNQMKSFGKYFALASNYKPISSSILPLPCSIKDTSGTKYTNRFIAYKNIFLINGKLTCIYLVHLIAEGHISIYRTEGDKKVYYLSQELRQNQFNTIIADTSFYDEAIILGDFNAQNTSEYQTWVDAGFNIANGSATFGSRNTLIRNPSEVDGDLKKDIPADNIITTQGIKINNFNLLDAYNLNSDHRPVKSTLEFLGD